MEMNYEAHSRRASRRATRTRRDEARRKEVKGEAILTAIDESVVVLLVGLGAVSTPLEMHGSDAFRPASRIIVERDFPKRANG